ncbi:replication initiation protein [Corynebacterium sp. NML130628]|uniref:replication initiation protein n=1 Tax=Corynebacterium sp. NML130628 TaxID=1906333 RepID=UPI0008FB6B62|nr:replication initiation protein [Corynebacterium sp. NML130628]OIR41676.1 replicase RepA [Corynebacterium sp. NML130628]
MSVSNRNAERTTPRQHVRGVGFHTGWLDDTPAGATDRDALLAHLGRSAIHASKDRNFSSAYYPDSDGGRRPRLYRVDSPAFANCQYVMLTTKQYAAVLVVDIDQPGQAGGHPTSLALSVRENFAKLIKHGIGPSWVGINPLTGKAQAIWLIDPVYADKAGQSPHMSLLAATSKALGEMLDHDPHFSHRFSRSPFYEGKDPTAYRWYCQHKRVHRLADLLREVRALTGQEAKQQSTRQQFSSGRELLEAAKTRRQQAEAFKALANDVEAELATSVERYDPDLIEGVRVLWINQGRAARDETAFRHALKVGHRLRAAGQRLTDNALIDAYEHGYNIAQEVGGDGRLSEMPPMRDRQTMARRVRGYVTQAKASDGGSVAPGRATSTERKALATMGRRGGQKAAQRWKTDPDGEYARGRRDMLKKANQQRRRQGNETRAQVYAAYASSLAQTGKAPTGAEIGRELGITRKTASAHLRALRNAGMIE